MLSTQRVKHVVGNAARALFLFFLVTSAHAADCTRVADMARDVGKLREAGVPAAAVEVRLRRDVTDTLQLAEALLVVRLVYSTAGSPEQIRQATISKCK